MRRLLACAALALAAAHAGAQAGPELGGAFVDFHPAELRALALPPPGAALLVDPRSLGTPAAVAPLPRLLDDVAGTRAVFRSGSALVHVYGEKSANGGDWFIIFAPEGGEPVFREGKKMIHWMMIKRTARATIGGESLRAYIQGNAMNRLESRLVVSFDDHSQPDRSWSIQELTDDGYEAGWPLTLAGRRFRLFYTRDFNQDGNGEFSGWTGDRSITLVTRDGGKFTAYHWKESEVPRDGVLEASVNASFSDGGASSLRLGVRKLSDGSLAIYDLAATR